MEASLNPPMFIPIFLILPNIVGLGGSIHDYATCIIKDEKILALEDERITRIRYSINSPRPCEPSFRYCLESLNLNLEEISLVVANDELDEICSKHHINAVLMNHHLSHAYSTFFCSDFSEAAILVVDGAGSKRYKKNNDSSERETTTYAYGNGNRIQVLSRIYGNQKGKNPESKLKAITSNSLGEFYRAVAELIGLGWLSGPGKMMGLAPYGSVNEEHLFISTMIQYVELLPEGKYRIRMNGPRGLLDELFLLRKNLGNSTDINNFRFNSSLANGAQVIFETILMHCIKHLESVVDSDNLCLAGGAALNAVANAKIRSLTKFKNVHVFYAPGDSGTAIGAAIFGKLQTHRKKEQLRFKAGPFLGKEYDDNLIKRDLNNTGLEYFEPLDICYDAAKLLSDGQVIAWFQGRSEFGPRALGNRSILGDPRRAHMRDHINREIKEREWYRPLAPSVIDTEASKYFDILGDSPWMQFAWPVKAEFRALLPSITHVDGSARVQTVRKSDNPLFFQLLIRFQELASFPIVLNTSFNIKGQPIVESPTEAIDTFVHSKINVLAIGKYLAVNPA